MSSEVSIESLQAFIADHFNILDKRIAEIDVRLAYIEQKLDAKADRAESDTMFEKMFAYMENRFTELDTKLDSKADKSSIDKIMRVLDKHTAEFKDMRIEFAALTSSVNRNTLNLARIADHIGMAI